MKSNLRYQTRRYRTVGGALAVIGTLVLLMGPAGAATSISPNPVQVTGGQINATVQVSWTQPANKRLFITQCWSDATAPGFDFAANCSAGTQTTYNAIATGSGTYDFTVFRGPEQSGDENWGCFAPDDVPPAGITRKYTTCYIRVTNNEPSNQADQQFASFTFVSTSPVIPETPFAVMIPVVALAVIGGGLFLQRRRNASS